MRELVRSSLASVAVTVALGAVVWWSVVEVKLANAAISIQNNKESIEDVKDESRSGLKDLKDELSSIDEKITAVLLLLSRRGDQ